MDLPIVQWRTPIALSNCDGLGVRSSPRQKNVPVRAAGEAPNNLNVSTRSVSPFAVESSVYVFLQLALDRDIASSHTIHLGFCAAPSTWWWVLDRSCP